MRPCTDYALTGSLQGGCYTGIDDWQPGHDLQLAHSKKTLAEMGSLTCSGKCGFARLALPPKCCLSSAPRHLPAASIACPVPPSINNTPPTHAAPPPLDSLQEDGARVHYCPGLLPQRGHMCAGGHHGQTALHKASYTGHQSCSQPDCIECRRHCDGHSQAGSLPGGQRQWWR